MSGYVIIYKWRIIGNQDFHKQNVINVTNVTAISSIIAIAYIT